MDNEEMITPFAAALKQMYNNATHKELRWPAIHLSTANSFLYLTLKFLVP
jgi:hypothetical protein